MQIALHVLCNMIPAPKVPTIIGTYMYLGGRYILKIAAAPAVLIPTYIV